MAEEQNGKDNSMPLVVPQENKALGTGDMVLKNRILKVLSPERATELTSGLILSVVELVHDVDAYPSHYIGMTPSQVGSLPNPNTNPVAAWAVDHIGDIWEISVGFTAMRLGFVAVNEVLKKEPIKKLTNGYQIPDEACFWASLATVVTVKAVHSLGGISLFGIHDHMANPVPGMLFGQGVAAVVLATAHYAAKYRESIKDLALRVEGKVTGGAKLGTKLVVEGAKFTVSKINKLGEEMKDFDKPADKPNIVTTVNTEKENEVK